MVARLAYNRNMKVLVAQSAGFCWGVSRAVDKARRLARERGRAIFTDGPLIHNRQMMAALRADGVAETDDPTALRDETLLIRAHGIPPERREWLRGLPVELVDATCPDVARIQGLIRRHARQGARILIFGDDGHAEVVGLLGFAMGRGHVVGTEDDVARLPDLPPPLCVVSQSTQFPQNYEAIATAIRARFPHAEVLDTICQATRNRQAELASIAQVADLMVIVGSPHSANTLRLVELARRLRPTRAIETADELRAEDFRDCATVGVTAGASTPTFIIDSVRAKLESFSGN